MAFIAWLKLLHGCHETVAVMQLESTIFFKKPKMTQRTLQLTQRGRSFVFWLVALNSLYTFFSTFQKALAKSRP